MSQRAKRAFAQATAPQDPLNHILLPTLDKAEARGWRGR